MFKMTLLKHFMPIALSVCMVVQSVPATAFAAEQTEAVVEETQTAETETDNEDVEVSETTPSTKTAEAEPEQDEQTQEAKDLEDEAEVSDDKNDTEAEESATEDSENPSTGGGYRDSDISNTEISDANTSAADASETTEAQTEGETAEDTATSEAIEESSSEEKTSEAESTESDLSEVETSSEAETEAELGSMPALINFNAEADTDARKLEKKDVTTGYSYATISAQLTGNNTDQSTYLHWYYREKTDANDTAWLSGEYSPSESTYDLHKTLTGLKVGTTYEYAIIIADSRSVSSSSMEDLPTGDKKVTDTFTTKAAPNCTVTITPVDAKCTSDTGVLEVKLTGSDETKLDVDLTLSNGNSETVTLKEKADYTNTVTFEGLEAETEYTIANAEVKFTETYREYYPSGNWYSGTEDVTFADIDPKSTFKTKAIVAPTSIAINQSELKMNLNYDSDIDLEVTALPEGASTDVEWSSSDTTIVQVYSDGSVSARGVGEATITATSVYDPAKTASCKVIVKDYRVILTDGSDNEPLNYVPISKASNADPTQKITKVYTNIGLCEISADGTKKLLTESEFNVTSNKPGVADWGKADNGAPGIAAHAVGTTRMTFEKDGYEAAIDVDVYAESKGFGITELTTDSDYPAIYKGADDTGVDTYVIAYSKNDNIYYTAEGMISPKESFYPSYFTWKSSNTDVATVNNGVIIPLKAGKTTITVAPDPEVKKTFTDVKEFKFTLDVKDIPPTGDTTVHALTNTTKTLADVKFPANWDAGWSWKEPQTPLYNLPVNDPSHSYEFEAVYTGDTYYPYEGDVDVYFGTITGVYAYEPYGYHHGVLTTDPKDSLTLEVCPYGMGNISSELYTISTPTIKGSGLSITPDTNEIGTYMITASSAGKYTLNLEIKEKTSDKTIVVGKYNLTVAAEPPIDYINLTSANENVKIENYNMIPFDLGNETKEFKLTAEAHNRDFNDPKDPTKTINTTTKLNWTITDKSVAAIKVDKDTRSATVTVKGEGHAVIQVTAADAAGATKQLKLEIKNHAPRVEGSKATINTAFDYEKSTGRTLSRNLYGDIEVVPVYGESVLSKNVTVQENGAESANFSAYPYSGRYYIIVPKQGKEVTTGTYKCDLAVTTSTNDTPHTYTYPITVSVINKKPKVTAKATQGMNLFYITDQGEAEVKLENTNYSIASCTWDNSLSAAGKGFEFSSTPHPKPKKAANFKYYYISQNNVRVKGGKLTDDGVDQGTLTVKLNGVKDAYTFENFKIKYTYKKPVLKTVDATTRKNVSNLIPSMGCTESTFYLYDNLKKHYLYYYSSTSNYYHFNELICDNDSVDCTHPSNEYADIYFKYTGEKTQDTLPLTVDSDSWRERLTVTHKVKTIQPKAVLSNAKLTYNTKYMNEASAYIYLKDYNYYSDYYFTDVAITGANAKAQKLLDDDSLQLIHGAYSGSYSDYYYSDAYWVYARLNKLKFTNTAMPSGSYAYNLTPYYTDSTGERKALNTVKLTITFTDKPITAKVSAKGTLDLAQSSSTSIIMTPKFSNMGTYYRITGAEPIGEYSEYFYLNRISYGNDYTGIYSLGIQPYYNARLKAGHTYNLAIVYTIETSSGEETLTVTSNKIKIKPKQTAPKITVNTKPQNLYAANDGLSRTYSISIPSTYTIDDLYGGLDVNKDGKADIAITNYTHSATASGKEIYNLTVSIKDRDAVIAAVKGKSYSIPVTVQVKGRDGISKDAFTSIKVNIKR